MKTAIIMPGMPSKKEFYDPNFASMSNYFWLPWLQKQLAIRDIPAQIPEIPNGWVADYPVWQKEFERYEITTETILVGHSCGGGFLVRWLSQHAAIQTGKVILIAPWLDPTNILGDNKFFNFDVDPELVSRTAGITIINSDNDYRVIQTSVKIIRDQIAGIKYRELHDRKHFYDQRSMELPEILKEIDL